MKAKYPYFKTIFKKRKFIKEEMGRLKKKRKFLKRK